MLAGIIAAGAAAGITLALRRPGATVEPQRIAAPAPTAQASPAPAAPVAPPPIAPPDEQAPPPAGQAAPLPAAKDEESQPPTTVAKGGNAVIKSVRDARPAKLKSAKSNRHAPKREKIRSSGNFSRVGLR